LKGWALYQRQVPNPLAQFLILLAAPGLAIIETQLGRIFSNCDSHFHFCSSNKSRARDQDVRVLLN
jgi:hypothetical protein